MTLRGAAIEAYQASQSGREDEARGVLASVLDPFDCSGLLVADVEQGEGFVRYVFTDSDLNLAVVLRGTGNEVWLAAGKPGDWTWLVLIESLAGLGKVLPGNVPPPDDGTGPAEWAPGVTYATGDEVAYGGVTYTCVQGHTSQVGWEPPNVPALWSVAA